MKIIRKLLWGIGIFLVLILAAMITVPVFFEDELKQAALKGINQNVNAKVHFSDVNLTLFRNFPHFTFVMKDFSVVGKDPFQGDTLTAIQDFGIALNLASVYNYLQNGDKLNIRSIELNNARVHVQVLEDGTASWDIAKASTDTTAPPQEEQTQEDTTGGTPFQMGLQSFEITNSDIIYDDASLGVYTNIQNLNHELAGDFTLNKFTLETYTEADEMTVAYGGVNYLHKVALTADADIGMNLKKFKFTFKDNKFQINHLPLGFDGFIAMPGDDIDMDFTYRAEQTDFKHILSLVPAVYARNFEDIETKGEMALNGYVKGTYNEERIPGFALNLKVNNAMFQYPSLPTAVNNINLKTEVKNPDGVPDHTVVKVPNFHIEIGDEPFDMKLISRTPISDPYIDTKIKGTINLANIPKIIPLEDVSTFKGKLVADASAKGNYSTIEQERYEAFDAAGNFTLTNFAYKTSAYPAIKINKMDWSIAPAQIALNTFKGQFGKSDMNAHGALSTYLGYFLKDKTLQGSFKTQSALLDLNEWMTEGEGEQETTTETSQKESEVPDTASLGVFKVPPNIDFTLQGKVKKVLYTNMTLNNVAGTVRIKDQRAILSNVFMNTLDGSITMNGYYDTQNPEEPKFDFSFNTQNLDVQKSYQTFATVKQLAPAAKHAHGKFDMQLALDGDLDQSMMPVYKTLNGRGLLKLHNVVVSSFPPLVKMAEKFKMDSYKKMRLNKVQPSFKIVNGKVIVDPFDVTANNTKMTISGHNTLDQKINYLIKTQVPRDKLGSQANKLMSSVMSQAQKAGVNAQGGDKINLDVRLKGKYNNPSIKVSYAGVSGQKSAEEQAKDKAKEVIEEQKEKAKEKVKEEVDKAKEEAQQKVEEKKEEAKKKAEKEVDKAKDKAKEKAEEEKEKAKDKVKDKAKDLNPFD